MKKKRIKMLARVFLIPHPIDLLVAVRLAKNCRRHNVCCTLANREKQRQTDNLERCCWIALLDIRRLHPSRRWCIIKTTRESLIQTTCLNVANTKHTTHGHSYTHTYTQLCMYERKHKHSPTFDTAVMGHLGASHAKTILLDTQTDHKL